MKREGRVEERIAVAAMALLVVITLANVVTRYVIDESFAWTEELSVFLMVALTLAGASAIAQRDAHIRIEFFFNHRSGERSGQPHRGLKLFSTLASSAVFMLLAALFARWVWDQYRYAETSMGLGVPLWWYGLSIPPLMLAISARFFQAFLRALRGGPPAPAEAVEPKDLAQ